MRFNRAAASIATAALLTACGGGSGDTPVEDQATMPFDGSWQGACAPDGNGYATETYVIADDSGSVRVRAFEDADCASALFEYESPLTLDYGDRVVLTDDSVAQSVDIVYGSSATITPLSDAAAANLSSNAFCDTTGYTTGVAADISGCEQAGEFVMRGGETLPQIAAVESGTAGELLLLGDLDSEALDATEVRPSALDRRALYNRNAS